MQGLAVVQRRRIAGISALEALAHVAALDAAPGAIVGAWIDAHRREIFSALYRVGDAAPFSVERLMEIDGAAAGDPAATLARWDALTGGTPDAIVGDGAMLYRDVIRVNAPRTAIVDLPLIAGAIGRLAIAHTGGREAGGAGRAASVVRASAGRGDRAGCGATWNVAAGSSNRSRCRPISTRFWRSSWNRSSTRGRARCTSPILENHGVSFCYVVRDASQQVVGYCSFWRVLDELHVNNVAVSPAQRGRGAGSASDARGIKGRGAAGRAARHARGAALERGGAAALRTARVFGRRHPPGLLHQSGRGRAHPLARRYFSRLILQGPGAYVTFGPEETRPR